jgi:hypothetical protein
MVIDFAFDDARSEASIATDQMDDHVAQLTRGEKGVVLSCSCGDELGEMPGDRPAVELMDVWGRHGFEVGYFVGKLRKAREVQAAIDRQ